MRLWTPPTHPERLCSAAVSAAITDGPRSQNENRRPPTHPNGLGWVGSTGALGPPDKRPEQRLRSLFGDLDEALELPGLVRFLWSSMGDHRPVLFEVEVVRIPVATDAGGFIRNDASGGLEAVSIGHDLRVDVEGPGTVAGLAADTL